MMVAMVLVAVAPALAQNEQSNYGDQYTPPDLYDQVCEIAAQEEAQRILDEDTSDPHDLDADGDGVACNSEEPADERVTLNYELTVEGECPADATFFGESKVVDMEDSDSMVRLTDPDGDGVYTNSGEFIAGEKLDRLSIVQGTGVVNGPDGNGQIIKAPGGSATTIESFDPITIEEDTTLSASVSCDGTTEPRNEEATLNFELTVEGQCSADTSFFAGMSTSHGYSVPLVDPEGDGVYSGSIDFGKGVDLLEVGLYKGTGIQEGPYGQIPVGEPETIRNFGPLTVDQDETFSATVSCDETTTKNSGTEPAATKNSQAVSGIDPDKSEKNVQNTVSEKVRAGVQMLPDTGGMSFILLGGGGGVLLVAGGLVARRIFE